MSDTENPKLEMYLLGITNALQALAVAALDTEEKRSAVEKRLDEFAELILHSDHDAELIQSYLGGLACLGLAVRVSRQP